MATLRFVHTITPKDKPEAVEFAERAIQSFCMMAAKRWADDDYRSNKSIVYELWFGSLEEAQIVRAQIKQAEYFRHCPWMPLLIRPAPDKLTIRGVIWEIRTSDGTGSPAT